MREGGRELMDTASRTWKIETERGSEGGREEGRTLFHSNLGESVLGKTGV